MLMDDLNRTGQIWRVNSSHEWQVFLVLKTTIIADQLIHLRLILCSNHHEWVGITAPLYENKKSRWSESSSFIRV